MQYDNLRYALHRVTLEDTYSCRGTAFIICHHSSFILTSPDYLGVEFLFRQYGQSIGGILADDMGLGKTVQSIAFCAALLGKTGSPEDDITQKIVGGKQCDFNYHPL